MQNKLIHISYIRIIVTLLVILFHSYAPYFYDVGLALNVPCLPLYKKIFTIEELIQMPLFGFISGYLYRYLYDKEKYREFCPFLKNKFKRLLLPYIIFGFIFYFTYPSKVRATIIPYNSIGHLWFLPMLFWCFMLQWILSKMNIRAGRQLLLSFTMAMTFRQVPHVVCIDGLFRYFVYFNVGFLLIRFLFLCNINKYIFLTVFILLSVIILLFFQEIQASLFLKIMNNIIHVLVSLSGLIFILRFAEIFKNNRENVGINSLDRCSLGMYIFHYWIMLWLLTIQGIAYFASDHVIIYPILIFLFLSVCSYIVTRCFLSTKIGRELI